jgi:hypothetical protein
MRSRRFAGGVRRKGATIDGLALMEWVNPRLGKAQRFLDSPPRSPIAASAQIYMCRN